MLFVRSRIPRLWVLKYTVDIIVKVVAFSNYQQLFMLLAITIIVQRSRNKFGKSYEDAFLDN